MTLIEAARALVARWDTPVWKDAPHTANYIDALRTAIAEAEKPQPVAVPAGWKLVPVEPTQEMCDAHVSCHWPDGHDFPDNATASAEWRAMLAAAPAAPAQVPLTDYAIAQMMNARSLQDGNNDSPWWLLFARDIERAVRGEP